MTRTNPARFVASPGLTRLATAHALVLGLLASLALGGCKSGRTEVVMFCAASLARAMSELEQVVEAKNPRLDLRLELSGSQEACRKLAELNRRADVVATADYRVIDRILLPDHADHDIHFATNSVVLAHMDHSRYTEQITADNWYQVLQRPGVRLGLVDPDLAPIGYRTLLVLKLAGRQLGFDGERLARTLRKRCAPEDVAPHEGELLKRLQARAIDYAFVYRSTAEEHNLKLVALPDSYNLGAAERQQDYAAASVQVRMRSGEPPRRVRGSAVIYGVTIPRRPLNPEGARQVVAALLGKPGQRALSRTGFRPLVPARCAQRDKLPPALRALTAAPRGGR
jgi:molybdate/tungstate transport system substrate-binding protein